MQFDFSDEQKELRDSVRRFLEKKCPISVVRGVADGEAGHDAGLFRELGYAVRSLRGIDLFPSSHHVEAVAVLTR